MNCMKMVFAFFVMLACLGAAQTARAAPQITITSPTNGATIDGSAPVTFRAQVGTAAVAKVEYYVGNTLACTSTAAPDFACTATPNLIAGTTTTITLKAYNKQGKLFPALPPPITINTKPAPPPPPPPAPAPAVTPVPLYRLFNPKVVDHFYTTNAAEADRAGSQLGYNREGTCCKVLASPGTGAVPLYRAYQPTAFDHFYTANKAELNNAVAKLGYKDEGIAGYLYPTQQAGTVPLYRAYQPVRANHFYTTNKAELDNAVAKLGYKAEGIAGYVYPAQ